jgi:hypothetical protein
VARRRIEYHALAELGCLGELTPYALDDRIDVADAADDAVVVHTENFAPARTPSTSTGSPASDSTATPWRSTTSRSGQ